MRLGILAILALTLSCVMVGCKGDDSSTPPPAAGDSASTSSPKTGQAGGVKAGLIPGGAPEKQAGSAGK